jgi:hypothetical protein
MSDANNSGLKLQVPFVVLAFTYQNDASAGYFIAPDRGQLVELIAETCWYSLFEGGNDDDEAAFHAMTREEQALHYLRERGGFDPDVTLNDLIDDQTMVVDVLDLKPV